MNFDRIEVCITVLKDDRCDKGYYIYLSLGGSIRVKLTNVIISNLLLSRFNNLNNSKYEYDKTYTSLNNSDDYDLMPLSLVKLRDYYLLTAVNVYKAVKSSAELMPGDIVTTYQNYYWLPKDYYRYVDTTVDAFNPKRKPHKGGVYIESVEDKGLGVEPLNEGSPQSSFNAPSVSGFNSLPDNSTSHESI